jgi:hypothetical protein
VQRELSSKFSLSAGYTLAFTHNNTDDAYTTPDNSYDLSTELGRASIDERHQFYVNAYVALPWGIEVSPGLYVGSGVPFNITTGFDNRGDTLFTHRPAFAEAGDPGAIVTPFGIFNPNPGPGDPIIPRNFGQGPRQVNLDLSVSRTFNFGPAKGDDSTESSGDGSNTAERASREKISGGYLRRMGQAFFARDRRRSLTLSLQVENLLNHVNFGNFVGVLTSPLFGKPNYANDPRRIYLNVEFRF